MRTFKDLTGMVFNNWTVIKLADSVPHGKGTTFRWECKCKCGNTGLVRGYNLTSGQSKGCGCGRSSRKVRVPDGQVCFNNLYKQYRWVARQRGYAFLITREEAFTLFTGCCYFCGSEPKQIKRAKRCASTFTYNGIDRLDNTLGYTVDNCVSCCKYCNRSKDTRTVDDFKAWIGKVYNHMKGLE